MNNLWLRKHRLALNNPHLIDLLNKDYYIELGNIKIDIFDELLSGVDISINNILDINQVNNGLGKLTDNRNDYLNQLEFLKSIKNNNLICSYILTAGVVRYYTSKHKEKLAPLVIIPIQIDFEKELVSKIGDAEINNILLNHFIDQHIVSEEEISKIKYIYGTTFNSVYDIDMFTVSFRNHINLNISTESYLSFAEFRFNTYSTSKQIFNNVLSTEENDYYEINKYFFDNIKYISNLNGDQKYACNLAHQGKSFVIEGKSLSGKTTTLLNIVSDAVINNKNILYVNNNFNKLLEFNNLLSKYNLYKYVYSFYPGINNNTSNTTLLDVKYDKVNNIDTLLNFQDLYDKKYLGYKYSYILEKLAIYKKLNIIPRFKGLLKLEPNENEQVSECLKKISFNIKGYNFSKSVWNTLLADPKLDKSNDIKDILYNLIDVNNNLNTELKDFCEFFKLKNIKNINTLRRIVKNIQDFESFRPAKVWLDDSTHELVNKNILLLGSIIKRHTRLKNIESLSLNDGYTLKDVNNYYNSLANNKDETLIKKIIANNLNLESLQQSMINIHDAHQTIDYFKSYFKINTLSIDYANFFDKVKNIVFNKELNIEVLLSFLSNPNLFIENNISFIDEYNNYNQILNEYNKLNLKQIDYNFLKDLNKDSLIKIYAVTLGASKNNIIDTCHILKDLRLSIIELDKYIKYDLNNNDKYTNFYSFITACNSLNKFDINIILSLSKEYSTLDNFYNSKFYQELILLEKYARQINIIREKLDYYNFNNKKDLIEKELNNIENLIIDVNTVIKNRTSLFNCFKEQSAITYDSILEYLKCYKEYLGLEEELKSNSDDFKHIFGVSYNSFDTNILDIQNSYYSFNFFKTQFIDYSVFEDIFNNDSEYKKFISYGIKLDNYYNSWLKLVREFSSFFRKSLVYLQNVSLSEVSNILNKYVLELDNLNKAYNIISCIQVLDYFNLKEVISYIYTESNFDDLEKEYMYSVLLERFNEASDLIKFDKNKWINEIKSYNDFINQECIKNTAKLTIYNPLKHKKSIKDYAQIIGNILDDDANMIFSMPNDKKIFLCDTLTFNTFTNLFNYDLVLIDNAELSDADTYALIDTAKQVIVSGDLSYKLSVSNGLLQRINIHSMIHMSNRYLALNEMQSIDLSQKNIFLPYTGKVIVTYEQNIKDLIKNIILNAYNNKIITGIYVSTISDNRLVNKILFELFNNNLIDKSIYEYIYITNPLTDVVKTVKEGYVIVNKHHNAENSIVKLFYQNIVTTNNLTLIFNSFDNYDEYAYLSGIKEHQLLRDNEIGFYIKKDLMDKGLFVYSFEGLVNLIIKFKEKMFGIVIYGRRTMFNYSLIDDYMYINSISKLFNYHILEYSVDELYNNYEYVLNDIYKKVTSHDK